MVASGPVPDRPCRLNDDEVIVMIGLSTGNVVARMKRTCFLVALCFVCAATEWLFTSLLDTSLPSQKGRWMLHCW